jgi:ornithine--oxo-acid transaminase
MTATDLTTQHFVHLEDAYSAHNYHPLDVVIERGEGVWVWDVEGNKYLDFLAAYGAVNQGHNHPRIVAALIEQAQTLALTSRAFRNNRFGPFCEKLSKLSGYEKVLMMNAGAEAVETAIKASRRWGYREKQIAENAAEIIVFGGNFHGRTTTIVSFSDDAGARSGYGPYTPGFVTVPYGDLEATRHALNANTCAIFVEPIQGEGGVILPPAGFLKGLRQLCDENDVLLICDEIQSGLGRTGHFFAHTGDGVRADGVTIGKALSGGLYPVSAFLADDSVMGVFDPGSHGSTFGGNPLACAVAEAALDVLVDEGLIEHAQQLGAFLKTRLESIHSAKIKEIRCAGLWAGIELHPEAGGARQFSEAMRREGVLVKETHEHTLRLAPPLVIQQPELEMAVATLESVLQDSTGS